MTKQTDILKFWRDIEIFNLPDAPKKLEVLRPGVKLPWEIAADPLSNGTHRYIVCFGIMRKSDVVHLIEELIGDKEVKGDWIAPVSGKTCMAALMLDENGLILEEGAYLQASYLHGIKCLSSGANLNSINERLEKVQEEFKDRYQSRFQTTEEEDLKASRITWLDFAKEIEILNSSGFTGLKCNSIVYYKSINIAKKAKNGDAAFLTAFIWMISIV